MAISYNIYANDGQGGEVDYSSPITSTANLSQTLGPLAAPSDNRFGVRAFDTVSGIEEANTNVRVRIILDASGNDVSALPNPVMGLSAKPTAGGTCWVSWGYDPSGQGGPPVRFRVDLTPVGSTPTTDPAATIDYLPGVSGYGCSLGGLAGNTPSTIGVRAVGASNLLVGEARTVAITYPAPSLADVDMLVAVPSA